jgi:hypothetical protein
MMLYQAHTMRVVNQQKALEGYRQELWDLCAKEKNTEAQLLYIVIDFKMKWESMYLREKTTDHFGKRGISWHGNRIEFFIWNNNEEKVESRVIKLDQILSGVNKQDAMTVLALLEAMQVYCSVEFPGATIAYVQSDNASYYQAKQVVVGIPLLNAVSTFFELLGSDCISIRAMQDLTLLLDYDLQQIKKSGGPVIRCFVHSETQDGKSLLDAHFAHATALIKRFLKRVRQNLLNKVTSPSELAEALADQGGLKNCAVQLVNFDLEVCRQLAELQKQLHGASKQLGSFFARANEFRFITEKDEDDGRQSTVRVIAYSGIGNGAVFSIDIVKGTATVCCESTSFGGIDPVFVSADVDNDVEDDVKDDVEDDEEVAFTQEEEECQALLEPFYLAEANNVGNDLTESSGRGVLLSTNGNAVYNCTERVTRVKVDRVMVPLSNGRKKKSGNSRGAATAMRQAESHSNLKTVLARGIRILSCEDFGAWGRQAANSSNPAYLIAADYIVPESFVRAQAWARRPRYGEQYGKKYIGPYKAFLRQLFVTGKDDDSRKMNGDQMFEALAKAHPLVYTLPSTDEIGSFISQCFKTDKSNLDRQQESEEQEEEQESEEQQQQSQDQPVQVKYTKEIKSVLETYNGKILPRFITNRLAFIFQNDEGFTYGGRDDSSVPSDVHKCITKLRLDMQKQSKKLLIG